MTRKNLYNKLAGVLFILFTIFTACDEYLDKTPDADISERDMFGTYPDAQGFVDKQYAHIIDKLVFRPGGFMGYGDDFVASLGIVEAMARGSQWTVAAIPQFWSIWWYNGRLVSPFNPIEGREANGMWPMGWVMIRDANLMLKNMDIMTDATKEERDLIRGQALFFRAYHYWNYVTNWGGMPYIDKFIEANDDPYLPRLNTWETIEKIVIDLDNAAALLPDDWDNTVVGKDTPGKNQGRITKGACIALKAKALLFAGSPLFVLESSGIADYNAGYLKRSAEASWEVIKMANEGVYGLVPWDDFFKQFARNDGFSTWSEETILACVNRRKGRYVGYGGDAFLQIHGCNISPLRFAGNTVTATVTQNTVEMFEMENGLPIDDPSSGYDPMDPWVNRDPRFRGNILLDGDMWTFVNPEENKFDMWVGGKDYGREFMSPFLFKKYWPKGCNTYDKMWTQWTASNPVIRLGEIYLFYAETVNEVWGPDGTAPGASLTAVEAVNIVRARAGMPPVAAKFLGSKEAFRERIWNERAVELLGEEGSRWYDLRRWYVAHLDKYKVCYKVEFDKDYTYFNKLVTVTKLHEQKHYWMPIDPNAVQVYSGFYQNPGW